jgi:hypothetical protein
LINEPAFPSGLGRCTAYALVVYCQLALWRESIIIAERLVAPPGVLSIPRLALQPKPMEMQVRPAPRGHGNHCSARVVLLLCARALVNRAKPA